MKNYRLVFRSTDYDKFLEIKDGRKTVETRAATVKYRPIEPGDKLSFVCNGESLVKTVSEVRHFASLDKLFEAFPLNQVLPSVDTIEDAKRVYYGFPGYESKIKKNGILAFALK